ncbi:MAG: PTS sugar transporter subunit IIA [Phycisphaerae bacterium]|nr:PTS sugar transporter subunit IIA [Phycisphaerae bacterium]
MKLIDLVNTKALLPELESVKRDDVITEMVGKLVASKSIAAADRDEIIAKIVDREKHGSTGFGKGVAVPHVKHKSVKKMVATIGNSAKGVDFNALDKAPVYSIVLLASPEDRPGEQVRADEHIQAMEIIFRNLQKDNFRRFLRQAATVEDMIDLIHEADTQQIAG